MTFKEICCEGYEDYDKQVQKDIEKWYVKLIERAQLAEVSLQDKTKDLHLAKDEVQAAILAEVLEEMTKMAEEQAKAKDDALQANILQMVMQENAKLSAKQQGHFQEQIATQLAVIQATTATLSTEQNQQESAQGSTNVNTATAGDAPQPDSQPEADLSYGGYVHLQSWEKAIAATVDTEAHQKLIENIFLLKKYFESRLEAIKWLEEKEPPADEDKGTPDKRDNDKPPPSQGPSTQGHPPGRECPPSRQDDSTHHKAVVTKDEASRAVGSLLHGPNSTEAK